MNQISANIGKILAADQLVKENKADVEQMKTDIGEAFSQAKLGIGSQESGFKEKIAEQEQQLTDTEAKLSPELQIRGSKFQSPNSISRELELTK